MARYPTYNVVSIKSICPPLKNPEEAPPIQPARAEKEQARFLNSDGALLNLMEQINYEK